MSEIRFKFAPDKAWDAIHWMVIQRPNIDLHTLLKACYFADKEHLNKHGRPFFGASYRAMKFDLGQDRYPWGIDGYRLSLLDNAEPLMESLSDSDKEEIAAALKKSMAMSFTQRTAATHGRDWQSARLGMMNYEDMIEESEEKTDLVAYLKEAAPVLRL